MNYSKVVSKKLDENLATMNYLFHTDKNKDFILREFTSKNGQKYFLACLDGMINNQLVGELIIRPLMLNTEQNLSVFDTVQTNSTKVSTLIEDATSAILAGDTAVFADGEASCVICETKGFDRRGVSTPVTEVVVKGSQESFTESIRTNITLIRKIIRSNHLCTEFISVGSINKNLTGLIYLDDIVNKKTLAQVRDRLNEIQGDFIMGSGMVEQLIEDRPFSLFPSILSTERPDRVSNYLASGRIGIVVDGSPFVIIVPVTLSTLLDSPEGNTQRWVSGTFSRLVRMFAFFCSTMLSGMYLAIIMFSREEIPTQLLNAIVSARTDIPFPSVIEVILMEIFFELVREGGLRTPNALGGAIGIVGALILGQSAVEANLVSPVTLIIVALSGLGNTALPDYDLAFGLRVIKILFILMGAAMGFVGIAIAFVLVLINLANQKSFGVPMLSMQALKWSNGSPVVWQFPLWKQKSRPRELFPQKQNQYPPKARKWDNNRRGDEA